jgi:hypothetical protein
MASSRPAITVIKGLFFLPLRSLRPISSSCIDDAIRAALSVTDHPKAASASPRVFYDNRFLQELENSGFVKDVYAGK